MKEAVNHPEERTKAIEIEDLVKRYKELVAINHLSLTIQEGEIFGLLGPNGSGKSTLIHSVLSLLSYDHGKIRIFGQPMHPDALAIKKDIGLVPQDIALYEELTVFENIDLFCGLYISDAKKRRELVDAAIAFVHLEDFRKFRPAQLSGGLKRRLNLACGIAHQPKLIFLDEPTVAVDPQSRNQILEGIKELNRQGATVVYTTHYMEEVEFLCDRLAILDHGQVIAQGTIDDVLAMSSIGETIEIVSFDLPQGFIDEVRQDPEVLTSSFHEGKLSLKMKAGSDRLMSLIHRMEEEGNNPLSVTSRRPSLNDVFLEITGKELRDHA